MDSTRWSNILRLDREFGEGTVTLSAGPVEAYVEVAARCNLRCQMCPITVDPRYDPRSGRPGLFAPALFERLSPFFPTLQRVYLIGLGEPTLHSGLVEFTRRLASQGVEVWITTNATLMDEEKAEALALAGLAHISVSIDGGTAETYERIRRRGRFADVVRGLRALGRARRLHGRPDVWLNTVATVSNLPELVQLVELCADAGGDGIFVEGLYPYPHPTIEEFCAGETLDNMEPERVQELFAAAQQRAAELGIGWMTRLDEQVLNAPAPKANAGTEPLVLSSEGEPPLTLPFACSEPWSNLNINASGDVRACCFNDQNLGNLNQFTIEEIWNGPGYTGLRRDMVEGRVPETCATCVRNGRVKRNTYLSVRDHGLEKGSGRGLTLELPADGGLVDGSLLLVGRREPGLWGPLLRAAIPEVYVDETWVSSREHLVIDRHWFAALVPVPFVTTGGHRLSLRPIGGSAADGWAHRWLQFGSAGGALTAVSRLAIPVRLSGREAAPELRIDGRVRAIDHWLCGRRPDGEWLGVAIASVEDLAPGGYDLALRFLEHPGWAGRLERLNP